MPKIIANLEQRLMAEAKQQVQQSGYAAMTIRSVARACGVGVGTVYNYFPSKDALLATYMLEDWKKCIAAIEAVSTYSDTPAPVVRCICDQLRSYKELHKAVFQDTSAVTAFAGSFGKYHALLRSQLADPLRKFCESDFSAEFIAESLLTWTMADKAYSQIYGVVEKLF